MKKLVIVFALNHAMAFLDARSSQHLAHLRWPGTTAPMARELNPILRPFAGSPAMYPAMQVVPTTLDLLAHWRRTRRLAVVLAGAETTSHAVWIRRNTNLYDDLQRRRAAYATGSAGLHHDFPEVVTAQH